MPISAFESIVREMLQDVAECDAGFVDFTTCRACAMRDRCSDHLETELKEKYPFVRWGNVLHTALGRRP